MKWTPRQLKYGLSFYPPYLGAGIRVDRVADDWRELEVSMKLRWYNRNAVGTHFGGSLYSMVDPHLMLLLMQLLGGDYVVWDQAATIHFLKPGRGRVRSLIRIDGERLAEIRRETADGEPFRPRFDIEVRADGGEVVARVEKVLYVRLKRFPANR